MSPIIPLTVKFLMMGEGAPILRDIIQNNDDTSFFQCIVTVEKIAFSLRYYKVNKILNLLCSNSRIHAEDNEGRRKTIISPPPLPHHQKLCLLSKEHSSCCSVGWLSW